MMLPRRRCYAAMFSPDAAGDITIPPLIFAAATPAFHFERRHAADAASRDEA